MEKEKERRKRSSCQSEKIIPSLLPNRLKLLMRVPSLSRPFPDTFPSLSRHFPDPFPTLFRPFPDPFLSLSHPFPDSFPTLSRPFPGPFPSLSWPFSVPFTALSQPFPGWICSASGRLRPRFFLNNFIRGFVQALMGFWCRRSRRLSFSAYKAVIVPDPSEMLLLTENRIGWRWTGVRTLTLRAAHSSRTQEERESFTPHPCADVFAVEQKKQI